MSLVTGRHFVQKHHRFGGVHGIFTYQTIMWKYVRKFLTAARALWSGRVSHF